MKQTLAQQIAEHFISESDELLMMSKRLLTFMPVKIFFVKSHCSCRSIVEQLIQGQAVNQGNELRIWAHIGLLWISV